MGVRRYGSSTMGPDLTHAPCDLSLQRRLQEARLAALVRRARPGRRIGRFRRRGSAQSPPADLARAALSGSEDVWRSLRV